MTSIRWGHSSPTFREPIIGNPGRGMLVPTAEQAGGAGSAQSRCCGLQAEYDATPDTLVAAQQEWEQSVRDDLGGRCPMETAPSGSGSIGEGTVSQYRVGRFRLRRRESRDGPVDTTTLKIKPFARGITGLRLDVLTANRLPAKGPGRAAIGTFVLNEVNVAKADGTGVSVTQPRRSYEQPEYTAAEAIRRQRGGAERSGRLAAESNRSRCSCNSPKRSATERPSR